MIEPVVLASASPRRRSILRALGIEPVILPTHVDESAPGLDVRKAAMQVAQRKAAAAIELCAANGVEPGLIIAADTCVAVDHHILGKPSDREEARRMLRLLSGRAHIVVTGLSLVQDGGVHTSYEETAVTFTGLDDGLIEAYIDTGEPFDKAGGYGIQEKGGCLVERIDGCYFNVAGLPVSRLSRMLDELGSPLWRAWGRS